MILRRRNFCANLVRGLFDDNTRKISNVSGKDKAQLNAVINQIMHFNITHVKPYLIYRKCGANGWLR